jgi:GLPGLI family protein
MIRFFFSLLLLLLSHLTFSQGKITFQADYVLSYSLVHSPDSNNLEDKDRFEYFLFGNSEASYWVEKGKYLSDSAISKMSDKPADIAQALQLLSSLPKIKSSATIKKNYTDNTIRYIDNIRSEPFFYIEPLNAISWKLENKNLVISGFNCQAATCIFNGRQYDAWFTTDIGINDGPYKFNGLPGTIVKIQDAKNHVHFELLSIKKEYIEISMRDKSNNVGATKVSSGDFKRMKLDALKNPLVGMENRGQVMDEENQKKVMERAKIRSARFNNPIELED